MIASLRHLLLAILVGGVVMILEIVAPRLVAPHLGTDALTWTAVITTFLLGLALGNGLGGWLADRVTLALLPVLLAASGGLALLMPTSCRVAAGWTTALPHGARVVLFVALAFLPVAILLGTVPPVLARNLLAAGHRPGFRLGLVSGAGALGSVVGTFLAGFHWVPTLGLSRVTLAAAALLGLSALLAPWRSPAAPAREGGDGSTLSRLHVGLALLAGAGILVVEILAGRIGAAKLGASIYTWTSVIGVVLVGLTLGAPLGGMLADRFRSRPLLAWLLALTSLGCTSLLWAPALLGLAKPWADQGLLSWPLATLAVTTLAFLPASLLFGTISPVIIRAALSDPREDGRVVGRLYAIGTVGAVLGAGLAAGVLIPFVGLERLILLLAFVVASASGFVKGRQPYAVFGLIIALAMLIHGPWVEGRRLAVQIGLLPDLSRSLLHLEDSRYSRIRVTDRQEWREEVRGTLSTLGVAREKLLRSGGQYQGFYDEPTHVLHWRGGMSEAQRDLLIEMGGEKQALGELYRKTRLPSPRRMLRLDRLVHGYVDLENPAKLDYGYEKIYATLLAHLWPSGKQPVRCFFIGGGAYAFQRHMIAVHGDGVRCVTAEIDPRVTAVAKEWLGLEDDPRHVIVHGDARTVIQEAEGGSPPFDLVFGDAFNHIAVPFHVTTLEFDQALAARMAPDGIYMVNVIDSLESGRFLGAFVRTLRQVFSHVAVVSQDDRDVAVRDTFIVVASNKDLALPVGRLEGRGSVDVWVHAPEEIDALIERNGSRILTDDLAPVEKLLAPVLYVRPDVVGK